ncbi:ubiquinone anaerobic biosynthesis protein UbiU [Azorhizobium doebereinerae]|uniref:ubiquinone anaerobic biosynthesis protein UbiU n=1 Tax=Azorhizobium doebereinerae TaxID=281091 RepID=UPI0003F78041|nr:peptidase U32 family protein [Azorhizobium doebereinerae]
MELICPAGTPAAFKVAVDAGADAVYCGFRDETNARNFPGLNFSRDELRAAITFAHERGAKVLVAINTFPRAGAVDVWHRAVDDAVALGADALILADVGLMDYVARHHPDQRLHVSVQAAAANADAIRFYVEAFGARRVVLPRVLTVPEIAVITSEIACETEAFVFGGLCVMAEGRCSLSSYATGRSPNMQGVCSPPSHVTYGEAQGKVVSRLGAFTINAFADGEPAAYPTLCKGRFATSHGAGYIFEEPASLDAATLLPSLRKAGVTAVKIEGRQRSRAYIESVVRSFRQTIAALDAGVVAEAASLTALTEGQTTTVGAYRKTWR